MNKEFQFLLQVIFWMLSGAVAMMGGHLVSDLSVWQNFFVSFAAVLIQKPLVTILAQFQSIQPLELIYDRVFLMQVNDPLLI
ncbi:hypothetical protein D3C87_1562260 [compost metagenome]